MMGLPPALWGRVDGLAQTMLQSFCPMLPADQQRQFGEVAMGLLGLFQKLAAGGACPMHDGAAPSGVDPASASASGLFPEILALAAAGTPGLSMAEALPTALDFVLGGYLSSAFLLGTAWYNLQQTPGAMQAYRQGDAAFRLNALEEIKRFDAPFQLADRYTARDMVMGGVRVPANSRVCLVIGSANHDESVFGPKAELFDIEREARADQNLVFGRGAHHCIGMPMAQITLPVVLNTLVDQCEAMGLEPASARWRQDPYFRAFDGLNARLRWRS